MLNLEWDRLSVYPYKEENIQELLCRMYSILEKLKENGQVVDRDEINKIKSDIEKLETIQEADGLKFNKKTKNFITLEELGAIGDGVADDISAFDKAKELLDNGVIRKVVGYGSYRVSRRIQLSSMNGIEYDLGHIKPYGVFRDDYLIKAGDDNGSQGNLIFKAVLIDGINKGQGGLKITSTGSSTFDIGTITNCKTAISIENPTQICSDNLLKGNYIKHCEYGIVLRSEGESRCEGTMIRYNFIYDNDFAGILLGKGSHYTDIQGVTDFNGKKTALIKLDSVTGFNKGKVFGHKGHTFTVVETMTNQLDNFIYVTSQTELTNTGIFIVGDTIEGKQVLGANFNKTGHFQEYLDIINTNDKSGFSRNTMMLSYCGGVYGSRLSLNTDTLFIAKTGQNERNLLSGLSIWSNSNETTISDYLGGKNLLKYNHKDSIDINGNGIYSKKVGYSNLSNSPIKISDYNGEKLSSGVYLVTIKPESRATEFAYTGILYWNKESGTSRLKDLDAHNMKVSSSGTGLTAQFGQSINITVWTTYLKIS